MVTKENMVTEESKQLRDYELVVIINPEVADEGVDSIVDNISRLITQKSGTVDELDRWGKRKLAYPIKHFLEGNYVLVRCKMNPASGKGLEASLRISEEVLRHLLVRLDS
ncbi:MAG: 30S ribosomal protein S6 [Dehalococcoidales bacterium]|jgi:small subunit ribosomal protein S6|nr:30S ribosomal protein S6 [Dehalococcoidales bacterium]